VLARGVALRLTGIPGGVLCVLVLAIGVLLAGCGAGSGTGGSGASTTPSTVSTLASEGGGQGSDVMVDEGTGAGATGTAQPDRAEIERRLALPRFTYVGEVDIADGRYTGALAVIDSQTDKLADRPRIGTYLSQVAVAPDGRLVYVCDRNEPVVHVVDAESNAEVHTVALPGVSAVTKRQVTAAGAYCYADLEGCSSAVACTPDGAAVLVLSKAGLQVVDTESFTVVRTLPELRDGYDLAVSFDGLRAYIATNDAHRRGKHTIAEWSKLSVSGKGGGLALLDLQTWQVVKRVKCGQVGGIAVDPDDSRIFCSDFKLRALRIVDPTSLRDLAVIDLTTVRAQYFQPRGVGVLPDGSKVYVVCAGVSPVDPSNPAAGASPDLFFCAVVDAKTREVVKRIPLDAY
jgi:DNA-binding beta-propeller fold protein YncE